MYASDLTNRKRAQALHSDISRQKALFNEGAIFRINYQKGGSDYAYMMELEQGCINNKCIGSLPTLVTASKNATTTMDIGGATYVDTTTNLVINPAGLIEYGYAIYVDNLGNSIALDTNTGKYRITTPTGSVIDTGSTTVPPYLFLTYDDVYIPLPMGTTEFYFFGQRYDASRSVYWSTNNAIIFQDPGIRIITIQKGPYPAILLGNGDRRLDKLYVRDDSVPNKYSILTLFVFYENNYSPFISIPNTGKYQIRIIRDLTGEKRQWIEVRVAVAPEFSGYIGGAGQRDSDSVIVDDTKLSPYNITNGREFLNPCGTTFSQVPPEAGTSFTFESDSTGSSWIFRNNTFVQTN